jgi:cobalt/nickel transport system permease protein
MQDALISPAVGAAFWAASAGLIGYSCRKVSAAADESRIPLMGVTGAFVFAAQMINFAIPGTGSSGHLGGGILLAILLGPWAGFVVMASILTVQALFFADGGLMALGCNMFNMGFWACLVGYPLIYKRIVGLNPSQTRVFWGAMLAAVVSLQMGAFSVVLQTTLSGISELPFGHFFAVMQPIHLAIGIVEGLVTAGVAVFVAKAQPQLLDASVPTVGKSILSFRNVTVSFLIGAVLVSGTLSWFASSRPDGLEWSMFKISGQEKLEPSGHPIYETLSHFQETTAVLPDYGFKAAEAFEGDGEAAAWPAVDSGTTVSGLVGVLFTLAIAAGLGAVLRRRVPAPAFGNTVS